MGNPDRAILSEYGNGDAVAVPTLRRNRRSMHGGRTHVHDRPRDQVHGPASGNNNWSEESAGTGATAVPALPLAGIGLLGLLLALLGSRAVLDDRRRLDASRGK